jgi:hypothetical protein
MSYYTYYNPNAGNAKNGVVTLSGSPLTYLSYSTQPWFLMCGFKVTSLGLDVWKPIIGSAYTNISQTGFWGLWLSKPNDYIHWRNAATTGEDGQFNGNTTLRVTKTDTWYYVMVKWYPSTPKNLHFSLTEVYNRSTQVNHTIVQTSDFSLLGSYGSITCGGWENNSGEYFPGIAETVTIGKFYTNQLLTDILSNGGNVAQSLTIYTSNIGINAINRISNTLTSSSTNVTITRPENDNDKWTISISTPGTYTLTFNFIDTSLFSTNFSTSTSIVFPSISATLTASQTIFYQKFVLSATLSFDVISSNAGTVSRTHQSNNTSIVSIPSSSIPSATIVGPGKVTIKVTQPATTNYTEIIENNLITIVIIGQGQTYTSENMTNTDLSNTNLNGSVFSSCNMTNVNLFGTTVNSSTNFSTATLTNVRSGRITGTTTLLPSGFRMI